MSGPVEAAPPTVTIRTYRVVGDGTYCAGTQTVIIPDGRTAEDITEPANRSFFLAYDRTDPDDWIGDCPFETDEPVPLVTSDDVLVVLRDQLPRPRPVMDPGHGLPGLRMYLETNRPLSYNNTVTVVAGGVSIGVEVDATATFTVRWGDDTVTGPHDDPGEPYPDGTVTHTYTHAGRYDIAVTDTWTIRWRFTGDGWNEAFRAELAPSTLPGFEIDERQAVRTR
ncbi:MAG: hypothetical protein WEB09_01745 [Nitriliruptor sp.]